MSTLPTWRRKMQVVEIHSCIPKAKPKDVIPIITASYPGSGAKLTWKLLRALTGIMTGDDHDHNGLVGQGKVVSIKTHYPALMNEKSDDLWDRIKHVPRVMILLRHPLNALPSYHNFEYEQRNGLDNHSTRAPLEAWVAWRDEHFSDQLSSWERLVRHYVETYPPERRIVTQFERITSKDEGTALEEMRKIGRFLKDGDDMIEVTHEKDLPCVWSTVLADKRVGFEGKRRSSLRKGGEIKYPFTYSQLEAVEAMLGRLARWNRADLEPFMQDYVRMIQSERKAMDDLREAAGKVSESVKVQRALQDAAKDGVKTQIAPKETKARIGPKVPEAQWYPKELEEQPQQRREQQSPQPPLPSTNAGTVTKAGEASVTLAKAANPTAKQE